MIRIHEARPERIERGRALVFGAPLLHEVVVEEHPAVFVPQERVHQPLAATGAEMPIGRVVAGTVLQDQAASERRLEDAADVDLVLVEEGVQVDRAEVGGAAFEPVARVVPGLAHGAVVDEVGVEGGLRDLALQVEAGVEAHVHPGGCGVGPQDGVEMPFLGFRGHADPVRVVAAQAGGGEAPRPHPDRLVLANGRLEYAAQPFRSRRTFREVGVDGQAHRGQERWLRAGEVVAAVGV